MSTSSLARLNVLMSLLLLVGALLLVTTQHSARKLSTELERAQGQMRELDVRYSQLQLEISKLVKTSLIDSRVRKELSMIPLSPARTLYLKEPN